MEPRNATTLPDARGWKVLATGAALGTLLVMVAPHAKAEPHVPPNPHAVTKCIVNGITTYSDQPCPDGIGEHRIAVDNAPPVSIVAAEAMRPARVRDARCDAAQAELHNIDALTKQGQPPDMQAFLEARRQQKRSEQFRYRC